VAFEVPNWLRRGISGRTDAVRSTSGYLHSGKENAAGCKRMLESKHAARARKMRDGVSAARACSGSINPTYHFSKSKK
jgi:hypothetical protein